ncbi:MAG TPA: SRPBCC domain-containing protein [Burkholderiales bacterium]|jgi:uncharacterized protein YndB with AHSA1/START domain
MSTANAMAASLGASQNDRHVTITRLVNAPRELVFAAWSERRHVEQWWRPKALTEVHLDTMDFRVGGLLRFRMLAPNGAKIESRIVYREITPGARLSYDEQCEMDGRLFHQARHTITFADEGAATRLTLEGELFLVPDRDPSFTLEFMREGWEEGWNDNLDLLEAYLPRASFVSSPGSDLVLSRQIAAPRELVFAAFTDAKQLAQWWGPKIMTNPVCESDARVGGVWNVTMRAPDGIDYPVHGVFEEVVPPARLVMRIDLSAHPQAWHDTIRKFRVEHGEAPDAPEGPLTLIITLEKRDGGTWLTVVDRFHSAIERNAHRDLGAVQGWSESMDRLAALLDTH